MDGVLYIFFSNFFLFFIWGKSLLIRVRIDFEEYIIYYYLSMLNYVIELCLNLSSTVWHIKFFILVLSNCHDILFF